MSRGAGVDEARYRPAVPTRDIATEGPPQDGGLETFDTELARSINVARLEHLASLGLDLDGLRVIDIGCGPGYLARYFAERDCDVSCVDARQENIDRLREHLPSIPAYVMDAEDPALPSLGCFDVVFCYGLLYHVENPARVLRNLVALSNSLIILETIICDSPLPVVRLADEPLSANQALHGIASRPSPSYVAMVLDRAGFRYVYTPKRPPQHEDFLFDWRGDLAAERDGANLRCVFVASNRPVELETLTPLLAPGQDVEP